MVRKGQVAVALDTVHLELIDDLQPFFGNSRSEVIRNIVINWLKDEIGLEGLKKKKVVK